MRQRFITKCVRFFITKCNGFIIKCDSYYKTRQYNAKTALVRPVYKKDDRDQIKSYRPVSLLNGFSKVCERFLHDTLSKFTDQIFSKFTSPYRKFYSSSHVLMRHTKLWKVSFDNKNLV